MSKERTPGKRKPAQGSAGKNKRDASRPSNSDKVGSRSQEPAKRSKGGSPDKFFARPEKTKAPSYEEKPVKQDREKRKPASHRPAQDGQKKSPPKEEVMPLNKYVAHCGICSRRDAAELVKEGKVKVNGEVILQPGHKIQPGDTVEYNGKVITSQKNLVYILLNKPKNYITTTDDPQERRTVMQLIEDAGPERVYPVGRLDRNTTGLLLLTNDGQLAQKLSHPKYNIKKVYHVVLDKTLSKPHFDKIVAGFDLEDGPVHVDAIAYLDKKNEIGIEIHSGRNRIVRRIFEHFGYVVDKLDRVVYAGLTKKNIPRGKWRFLNDKEIINLKHFKQ